MHKNALIALGVGALLLLIGVGGYFVLSSAKKASQTAPVAQTVTSESPNSEKISLKHLMGMKDSQSCTFSDAKSESSGTVYISGGKMRGEFSSKINGVDQTSHMLSDSKTVYIWMNKEKTGFKTSLVSVEQVQKSAMESIDLNSEVAYRCSPWKADALQFAAPSGIIFTDYSSMMKDVSELMEKAPSGGGMSPNNPASVCATCETMEDDAKTACKTALKCN